MTRIESKNLKENANRNQVSEETSYLFAGIEAVSLDTHLLLGPPECLGLLQRGKALRTVQVSHKSCMSD